MNLRYVLTGVVRHYLPVSVLFGLMSLLGGGNGAEQIPDQNAADLAERLTAEGLDLRGRHVLELGSGQYARFALRLLARGARRVTLVDLYATPLSNPTHDKLLRDDCALLGLNADDALSRITLHRGDFLRLPVPRQEQRPDLAISTAVLEHVRDPGAILERCHAWLAPGGVTFHIVDLRDHSMQFRQPFEMLTFSDRTWERWLDHPGGFHLNRWRAPDYLAALGQAEFVEARCEPTLSDIEGLRLIQPRLARRFRSYDPEQLAILGVRLVGIKLTGSGT